MGITSCAYIQCCNLRATNFTVRIQLSREAKERSSEENEDDLL